MSTLCLFDTETLDSDIRYQPPATQLTVVEGDLNDVPGLSYLPEFISGGEERTLLWWADQESEWSTHWSRRTKHFGMKYDRAEKSIDQAAPISPVPSWSDRIRQRLVEQRIMQRLPNQMGINEYMPGQGIASHVDYFGGTVVSLTLGAGCVMSITQPETKQRVALWLAPRSIIVLKDEARNVWEHGIARRLKDVVDGHAIRRERRISITFRDVWVWHPEGDCALSGA